MGRVLRVLGDGVKARVAWDVHVYPSHALIAEEAPGPLCGGFKSVPQEGFFRGGIMARPGGAGHLTAEALNILHAELAVEVGSVINLLGAALQRVSKVTRLAKLPKRKWRQ